MYISREICVYIISLQGFILNLSVYLDTDLINLNHMAAAFCSEGCAIQGNNSHILEALTRAEHVSKLMGGCSAAQEVYRQKAATSPAKNQVSCQHVSE